MKLNNAHFFYNTTSFTSDSRNGIINYDMAVGVDRFIVSENEEKCRKDTNGSTILFKTCSRFFFASLSFSDREKALSVSLRVTLLGRLCTPCLRFESLRRLESIKHISPALTLPRKTVKRN